MDSKGQVVVANIPPEYRLGRPLHIDKVRQPLVKQGPTKIYDYLYLGSWKDSLDIANLRTLGITGIVNAAAEYKLLEELVNRAQSNGPKVERKWPIDFDVCFLNLYNDHRFKSTFNSALESAIRFIEFHRKRGGKVLVQCNNGIERSAAIVLAFFMRQERLSYEKALAKLRNSGCLIHPNSWLEEMFGDEMLDD